MSWNTLLFKAVRALPCILVPQVCALLHCRSCCVGRVVDVVDVSLVLSRCRCVVIKNEVGSELNITEVVLIIKYDDIFICIFLIDVVDENLLLFLCI